jgi:glycosyltransferase involved in cell wall biosynthesis
VAFCEQAPYEELPAVYRGGDAFVLPSRAEGVPRTIMEAMATGVPVVSSDLPQVRGLVSDGGYTVDVGDHEAFAERLGRCLDGDYPDGGRERIVGEHSWADTVVRTTAVLREISDA